MASLRAGLRDVCSRDAGRLRARLRTLERDGKLDPASIEALQADMRRSAQRRAERVAAKPPLRLDPALPITAHADDIVELIRRHPVVVIAGETGSGKTTQIPKLCLAAGRGEAGLIGCTQPRRLAARAVATRVAEELNTQVGDKVGFQVRFSERVGEATLVKFMTDGILLAETQSDPWLSAYDTLIIDEAHERSLNIDFLLGYLKRLLEKRRDLKLIVTSATIDTARFAAHFGNAPVVEVEGRGYPVELCWRPVETMPDPRLSAGSAEHVAAVLDEITANDPLGDVLVFLPGEREIHDVHRVLERRRYRHTEVMPLYARLSAREQDRVFHPGAARRVVLATNVAETSLTVPRIRYVIDSGTARVKRYGQRSQIERLHVEPISQAAADQRMGRCGRVGPGTCYRLYGEAEHASRPRYTDPELLRSSLANVILRMLALKLGEVEDFPFIDAPEARAIADGYRRLAEISAIDSHRRLTAIGRELARWPVDVQLARMLVEARQSGVLAEVLVLVAFLSIQDPRERPAEARQQADQAHAEFADVKSDFIGVLNLWRAHAAAHQELTQSKLRDWCARHFLSFMRMREWRELHRQLVLLARENAGSAGASRAGREKRRHGSANAAPAPEPMSMRDESDDRVFEAVHGSLLAGLPAQVARKDDKGVYRGTRERRFQVFPGSALAKSPPNWLFAAQILDIGGKVWGMLCARVEPAWIERQARHLLRRTWRDAHWHRKRGQVVASEQVSLFGLVLAESRTVAFHDQDPATAHRIFLREALARCDAGARADFLAANARVLHAAREREARERRQDLLKDEESLAAFFEGKLPVDISSARALDAWYRKAAPAVRAALRWTQDDVLQVVGGLDAAAYPAQLQWQGQAFRLEYRFLPGDEADGVTLHLPLSHLNAFPSARGEWLVPGLLSDKVAEMIRGLPKALRRNFVPAPDFARAFVEAENASDRPLAQVLAGFLARTTGVAIGAEAFATITLPSHLLMRYHLHDEKGGMLATGRDLDGLRREWHGHAREAFSRMAEAELTREHVVAWDFDEIPSRLRSKSKLEAFPALVDLGEAVALRVFEHKDDADAEHRRGVERLLRLALAAEIKRARRQLPIHGTLALQYAPLGTLDALRNDLVEGGLVDLLAAHNLDVRNRADFDALREELARNVFASAMQRLQRAEAVIAEQAELKPWMEPPLLGFARASYEDLHEQFDALLAPGFLREMPPERLAQLPRYLKAMRLRAERLRQDPARDQQRMLQVLPYWRDCLALPASTERDALRWLVEEWRVSLFAQELKTAEPVSPKRLQRARQQALDAE